MTTNVLLYIVIGLQILMLFCMRKSPLEDEINKLLRRILEDERERYRHLQSSKK